MMDDEVNKKQMVDKRKLTMTFVIVLVTAAVFTTIGYVAGKNDPIQTTLTTDTTDLTTETAVTTATDTTVASATTTTDETADWKTYTNDEYGFVITVKTGWAGYKVASDTSVKDALASYGFFVPTEDKQWSNSVVGAGYAEPFVIHIFSKATYDSLKASTSADDPFELEYGSKLSDNGVYVATYSTWQDAPEDLVKSGLANEVKNVIDTFQFTK